MVKPKLVLEDLVHALENSACPEGDILKTWHVLAFDPLPRECVHLLIEASSGSLSEETVIAIEEPPRTTSSDGVIHEFVERGWIDRSEDQFTIASEVREILGQALGGETQRWVRRAISVLNAVFPEPGVDSELSELLEPHIDHLLAKAEPGMIAGEDGAELLQRAALTAKGRQRLDTAERYGRAAVRALEFGNSDPIALAIAADTLADIFVERQDYDRAEELHLRSLALLEEAIGADDPELAFKYEKLTRLYRRLENREQADGHARRCLELLEGDSETDPGDMAEATELAAEVAEWRGEVDRAKALYESAVVFWRRAISSDDPRLAIRLDRIAEFFRGQDELERAEPLYEEALRLRQDLFPEGDLFIAQSLNNLGNLRIQQRRYDQAVALHERAFAIYSQVLGLDHPQLGTSHLCYGVALRWSGDLAQAEDHFSRSVELRRLEYGREHPLVATVLSNLAGLYRDQGKLEQAIALYEEARMICIQAFGVGHIRVAQIEDYLAKARTMASGE